ncbi:MAG: DUF3347 domain-containing protein [Acidobacteria bacterium]|nr:DUF3347 domain-containing protein [Acidobacteriota bacterium]
MVLALTACGGLERAAPPRASVSEKLLDPYLKIGEALARDEIGHVKEAATDLSHEAEEVSPAAGAVARHARLLHAASDLTTARRRFGDLSEALVSYLDSNGLAPGAAVKIALCPMLKKPWLQKAGPLRNPYYGSEMLGCGEFRK